MQSEQPQLISEGLIAINIIVMLQEGNVKEQLKFLEVGACESQ